MNIAEMDNRRHAFLEALCRELNDEQIAAVVRKEEDLPEMVNAIFNEFGDGDMEVLGDFYFRPLQAEDDEVQVFTSVLTIGDDLPEEKLPALFEAMSYVNFAIPLGKFVIDKDCRFFCYELSTLMPIGLSDEEVFRTIDMSVGNAFSMLDRYIGILTDVLSGTIGAEGVVEFLGGPADAE